VTNAGADTVSVIDTSANRLVATIPVPGSPTYIAITPDDASAYVTNSELRSGKSVTVIDLASNAVTRVVELSARPFGLAITPDGTQVYVSELGSPLERPADIISIIDIATNSAAKPPIAVIAPGNIAFTHELSRLGGQRAKSEGSSAASIMRRRLH
jgi:YVTN family beta-propeller protein